MREIMLDKWDLERIYDELVLREYPVRFWAANSYK